jgi:diaminohydroxyphosphoribosylaminopyrimidine deaminase/5-amino-6-(5-phosphoribosylamino)uracil reductase
MVGAVIARDGAVLATGWHARPGTDHAEANAVRNAEAAGYNCKGATLYVTLEPCCYTAPEKHMPPCTSLIIAKQFARVVVAAIDPNPKVSGKGIQILRNAGITVETGLLASRSERLNRGFFTFQRLGRPFVHVKVASTLDGRIAAPGGDSRYITDEQARTLVHKWRAFYDAVLVGVGTVTADNPSLTVRLVAGRNPLRVVLDSRLSIAETAALVTDDERDRTVVVCSDAGNEAKAERLRARGVRVLRVPQVSGGSVSLGAALKALGELGVRSVLVEGGAAIFSAFLREGLWDWVSVFVAPMVLGAGVSVVSGLWPQAVADALRLRRVRVRRVGEQALIEGARE